MSAPRTNREDAQKPRADYICPSCGVLVRPGHIEDHGPHDIDASDGSQETIAT